MRKNTNAQNRSYFLFSIDNLKNAIRAKQELNKRKDMLGDKRVEVALLLDEEVVLKDHDLKHTEKLFQDPNSMDRGRKNMNYYNMDPNMKQGMMPMPMGYPPMYGNPMYGNHPPYMPYYQPPPYQGHFVYDPNYYKPPEEGEMYHNPNPNERHNSEEINEHIHEFLRDVLSAEKTPVNEKKPVKSGEMGREEDILSKLLGNEAKLTPDSKNDKSK